MLPPSAPASPIISTAPSAPADIPPVMVRACMVTPGSLAATVTSIAREHRSASMVMPFGRAVASIVIDRAMTSWVPPRVMVRPESESSKTMVSPGAASAIAWRSEPEPEPSALVTVLALAVAKIAAVHNRRAARKQWWPLIGYAPCFGGASLIDFVPVMAPSYDSSLLNATTDLGERRR